MYTLRDGQFIPDCPKNRQQLPIDIIFGSGAALGKGNLTNKKYNNAQLCMLLYKNFTDSSF